MKKKIVITGVSSLIMRGLADRIDTRQYEIIGISRNPPSKISNVSKIVKGDLQNIEQFSSIFNNCYMLIHGAAVTHSKNAQNYYKINLESTKKLIELSKKNRIHRFVLISSNTANSLNGAYSKSKYLAEEIVKNTHDQWTILRLSEIFGGVKKEGIDKLIEDAIKKKYLLCPIGLESKLYPIHVDDATKLLNHFIFKSQINRIYTINGTEGFSYLEIIQLVENVSKKKIKVIKIKKDLMFLLKKIVVLSPFKLKIVPDQIDRLYGKKHLMLNNNSTFKLSDYIETQLKRNKFH